MSLNSIAKRVIGTNCITCRYKKGIHPLDEMQQEAYSERLKIFKSNRKDKDKKPPFKKPPRKCHCSEYKKEPVKPCNQYIVSSIFKASMAITKIRPQFNKSTNSKFMFSIVEQAIHDLNKPEHVSARKYLNEEMVHAELCNVDSDWIRRVLTECEVDFKPISRAA